MMKYAKIITLLLAVLMVLSLSACGKKMSQEEIEEAYNGPPVKTTLSNFIVNQIFPILTLAASRATPFVQAAVSRLRQQVALTGRWWPVTLLPLRGAYT